MFPTDPISTAALGGAAILLLTLLGMRRRPRSPMSAKRAAQTDEDTQARWQPQAARVLTVSENQAFALLERALPGFRVLAQVPLVRFLRVPSYVKASDWQRRVSGLSADLLICDPTSRVLAVIDVRAASESERSRRRHERLLQLLRAAGVSVYAWREDMLPTVEQVRALLGAQLARHADEETARTLAAPSRPAPLIPIPEISEVLAEGDALAEARDAMEPVPSGFYDDDLDLPAAAKAP
jgi:hypothetical protein